MPPPAPSARVPPGQASRPSALLPCFCTCPGVSLHEAGNRWLIASSGPAGEGKINMGSCRERKGPVSPNSITLRKYLCIFSHPFFSMAHLAALSHRFCDWSKLTAVALTPWRAAARSKSKVLISQPWAAPFRWIFWPCNRSYRAHTSGILQKHTSCTEGSPALLWCHFMGERSCILAWLWPPTLPRICHFVPLHLAGASLFGSTSPSCSGSDKEQSGVCHPLSHSLIETT